MPNDVTVRVAPPQTLPAGYELDEYIVEKEIGTGGFGVTYKGLDKQLDRLVAIKEYFPFNLANRDDLMNVSPKTRVATDVEEYNWGLSRFIQEARALALFEHPNIIRVIRYIERNCTAYIIMEFADGLDISDVLKKKGLLSVVEVKNFILPIADGLTSVHSSDVLHRDIKPGNIRMRENGTAVLIDFGAARQAIGVRSQSISTILTPGYAPIEQYSSRGHQGPWTDIYALAAVGYVCLTGENLSHYEATERIRQDRLPKLVDRLQDPDRNFLAALDWAMSPEEADRPQSVQEWVDKIEQGNVEISGAETSDLRSDVTVRLEPGDPRIPTNRRTSQSGKPKAQPEIKSQSKSFNRGIIALAIGLCVGGALFYMAYNITEPEEIVRPPQPVLEKVTEPKATETGKTIVKQQEPSQPPAKQALPQQAPAPQKKVTVPQNSIQDEKDFNIASQIDTPEAYEIYLRLHPKGLFRNQAMANR